jgi:copper chaperone
MCFVAFINSPVLTASAAPSEDKPKETTISVDSAAIAALKPTQLLIYVQGMVCGMCVQGISILVKKLKGVTQVKINLERGSVMIDMSPNTNLTDEVLKETIADAGYKVQEIHRVQEPSSQKIKVPAQ